MSWLSADELNGKAGNMNFALKHIFNRPDRIQGSDVVAVFDCDQVTLDKSYENIMQILDKIIADGGDSSSCESVLLSSVNEPLRRWKTLNVTLKPPQLQPGAGILDRLNLKRLDRIWFRLKPRAQILKSSQLLITALL